MSPDEANELADLRARVSILSRKVGVLLERTGMDLSEIEDIEIQELTAWCIQSGDFKLNAVKVYLREKNAKKQGKAA